MIDAFWKWLMRMDARGIFILSLVLFLATVGWWGWRAFRPDDRAPVVPVAEGESPKLPSLKPLGIVHFVSNQFAPRALVVPLNPFRPTYASIISNLDSQAYQELRAATEQSDGPASLRWANFLRQRRGSDEGGRQGTPARTADGTQPNRQATPQTGAAGEPPPPSLTFRGMFERPDGKVAAYLFDSVRRAGHFVTRGERIYNLEVMEVRQKKITFKMPDDTLAILNPGETITVTPDP